MEMKSSIRPPHWIAIGLLTGFVLACLFELAPYKQFTAELGDQTYHSTELTKPIVVPYGETFIINPPEEGATYRFSIFINNVTTALLPGFILELNQNETTAKLLNGKPPLCKPVDKGYTLCEFIFNSSSFLNQLYLYPMRGETVMGAPRLTALRNAHTSHIPSYKYLHALAMLLAAIPIVWLLHRKRQWSEWFIAALGISILGYLEPYFTAALLAYLLIIYQLGHKLSASNNKTLRSILLLIISSVAFWLAFKYALPNISSFFPTLGGLNIGVPLGISYFVVRLIDIQLRWYRGELKTITVREYLSYIIFPTTIPAGPIETIDNFHKNRLNTITKQDIAYGLGRAILGVCKKVIIADGLIAPLLFGGDTPLFHRIASDPLLVSQFDIIRFCVGTYLFAYIDFSAYCDIAIGLSRLLGYPIIENFNWPILACNVQDFWRRWHISLSQWCFRNIYFPLVVFTKNRYLPLYVTMITIGVWHYANLSWYSWGLYHATGLSILTFAQTTRPFKNSQIWQTYCKPLRIGATFLFVSAAYSFVAVSDFRLAATIFLRFWGIKLGLA